MATFYSFSVSVSASISTAKLAVQRPAPKGLAAYRAEAQAKLWKHEVTKAKQAEAKEPEVEEYVAPPQNNPRHGRPGTPFSAVRKARAAKALRGYTAPTGTASVNTQGSGVSQNTPLDPETRVKLEKQRKWENREFGWQGMLVFIRAKYGVPLSNLTCEEWESKQLSPERVKTLGLRSPKLSKAMVAFGVPQQEVAILLGANYAKKDAKLNVTRVLNDYESCLDQGNSIYYRSCQATDKRAQWQSGNTYYRVPEELKYLDWHLFLWVVGERMSIDGKGFEARAKLRIMYKDRGCTEVAGLYIDRPYGKYQLLLDNLSELQEWWDTWCREVGAPRNLPILMPPVWNRENGAGNDFQRKYGGRYPNKLFCPSAEGGYQDTLTHGIGGYDFFQDVCGEQSSILVSAYMKRSKFGGVYYSPLKECTYNPQKGQVDAPTVRLEKARGVISDEYRKHYKVCREYFGAERFEQQGNLFYFYKNGTRYQVSPMQDDSYQIYSEDHVILCSIDKEEFCVFIDEFNLGIYRSHPLPYCHNNSFYGIWTMYVDNDPDNGFWSAINIDQGLKAKTLFHAYSEEKGLVWEPKCRFFRCDTLLNSFVDINNEETFRLWVKPEGYVLSLKDGVISAWAKNEPVDLKLGLKFKEGLGLLGVKDIAIYSNTRFKTSFVHEDYTATLEGALMIRKAIQEVLCMHETYVEVRPYAEKLFGAPWAKALPLPLARIDDAWVVSQPAFCQLNMAERARLKKYGWAVPVPIR